jgi:hypothetical protein
VVGATGAGLANVGFVPPAAKVVEIMPENHADQFIRRLSLVMGLRWYGYIHRADDVRGLRAGNRYFPSFNFSFELPLDDFERALDVVEGV